MPTLRRDTKMTTQKREEYTQQNSKTIRGSELIQDASNSLLKAYRKKAIATSIRRALRKFIKNTDETGTRSDVLACGLKKQIQG